MDFPRFCHICASDVILKSQMSKINQQWDYEKHQINPKIPAKAERYLWDEDKCPHQILKQWK